jgi:hypothetical protein
VVVVRSRADRFAGSWNPVLSFSSPANGGQTASSQPSVVRGTLFEEQHFRLLTPGAEE